MVRISLKLLKSEAFNGVLLTQQAVSECEMPSNVTLVVHIGFFLLLIHRLST